MLLCSPNSRKRVKLGLNLGPLLEIMARIMDHGPEFWHRIYQYMPWDGKQHPSSKFGIVHDILGRNFGGHMIYQHR